LYFSNMDARRPRRSRPQPHPDAVPAYFLYGEPLRPPDEGTVHVETIAARSRLYDWKIRPHRHRDLHQVLIVWRGTMEAQFDARGRKLAGPAVVVVPPGTVHSFRFAANTEGLVVTFAAGLARELLRAHANLTETLDEPAAVPMEPDALYATDLEELGAMLLRESARSARGRDVALRGLLGALLANLVRLLRGPATSAATAGNRARELVARFRGAVERHYREHLGLAAYAAEIRTSEAALRRACRAVAGQSPTELVRARLLIEAERQLRYTGMSVTQIAYFLGFEDPAYFSRFFNKRMGTSPRAFGGCRDAAFSRNP
jgi:AraC family transcriptional activator of pobA